jgi:hypothetical protein
VPLLAHEPFALDTLDLLKRDATALLGPGDGGHESLLDGRHEGLACAHPEALGCRGHRQSFPGRPKLGHLLLELVEEYYDLDEGQGWR